MTKLVIIQLLSVNSPETINILKNMEMPKPQKTSIALSGFLTTKNDCLSPPESFIIDHTISPYWYQNVLQNVATKEV